MKTRIITGTILAVVFVAVLALTAYVHPIFLDIFMAAVAVCGAYEMTKALENIIGKPILAIAVIGIGLGFGAFWFAQYFFNSYAAGLTAYFISLAVMVIATFIVTGISKVYVKSNALATVFTLMYPCAISMFTVALNYFTNLSLGIDGSTPYRNAGVVLMFLVPTLTDVFAYFVGSRLKGKKLCPTISPNKTISGAIGGLFGGLFGSGVALLAMFLFDRFGINVMGLKVFPSGWTSTIIHLVVLGIIGSVFDQIGDLFASYIKRRAGIKDFSNLLPGHGGVLDRMDGFLFTGIFFYLYFAVLVLL